MSEPKVVGKSVPRIDAVEKVTGRAQYAIDLTLPDMVHGVCARSAVAHANLIGIRTEEAREHPDVLEIITGTDILSRGWFPHYGHAIVDHPILALEKIRFVGEPVALVLAETRRAAAEAADLIEIEYDELPRVMNIEEALDENAPIVHDRSYEANEAGFLEHEGAPEIEAGVPNVFAVSTEGWGDVENALRDADVVVEETFRYPITYGYAMEPYNALAQYVGGELTIWTTAQHPYMVRDELARIFGLPLSALRVHVPYLGGGYGTKSYTKVEPLAAIGAIVTGRPAQVILSIDESILTTRAESAVIKGGTAFAEDGMILARWFDLAVDAGAYADSSPMVAAKMANRCSGPYLIPNLRVRSRTIYTNTIPASSLRGFGGPQAVFAGESLMDMGAEALGMDPYELRVRNLATRGEVFYPGMRALDSDLHEDIDILVKNLQWLDRTEKKYQGIGFALAATNPGDRYPIASALIRMHHDGTATLMCGATEMGQGSRTVLTQIAAEELGLPMEAVSISPIDTSAGAFHRTTGASRSTTLAGLAIQLAVADLMSRIIKLAAEAWGVESAEIRSTRGGVLVADEFNDFGEVLRAWYGTANGEAIGFGATRRAGELVELPIFWEVGVTGVEIEVDPETFAVTTKRLVTVGDCGFAINPQLVKGQEQGAAIGGLGVATSEELIYEGSEPINASIVDYRVPRITDWPENVEVILAERGDGVGPYGARGSGEGSVHPMVAAMASAVTRAIGVRPTRLPMTPERLWRAVHRIDGTTTPDDGAKVEHGRGAGTDKL